MANVIKHFLYNHIAIAVTDIQNHRKNTVSGVNYATKSFITLVIGRSKQNLRYLDYLKIRINKSPKNK